MPANTTVINGQNGVDWLRPSLMVMGVVAIMVISYLVVRRRWMTPSSRV
ncbi:MAG: hypothetical protein NWE87_08475 [Candidatus Bathyarchaeota archaeon]|nr:hypothetical protein [Candidatus Bathyarchaeota archaeon]